MESISGKIIFAGGVRSGVSAQSGQQWASQDFTIEAQYQTPAGIIIQRLAFNVFGSDKLAEYALRVGDECTVHYNINAREYQGKWYNDVRASKIEKTPQGGGWTGAQNAQQQAPQQYNAYNQAQNQQPQQQFQGTTQPVQGAQPQGYQYGQQAGGFIPSNDPPF